MDDSGVGPTPASHVLTLAMHAAATAGDWTEALRLGQLIRPIEDFRARAANSYNISFLKAAINVTGLDFGAPRTPQRQLTADEVREVERVIEPILAAEREMEQLPAAR